jgi:hypothetical protein|uniref:Uncharacterized protein n=1 Tax=viral metagenome TaxID=1070528 RepID=A0A6C0DZ10_9ZZZZ
MDYNFDIECNYGTIQKFLALNEHNQCDDDYDSKFYEMKNVMRRTQKEKYNNEKIIINDTLYECGDIIHVSYITSSQVVLYEDEDEDDLKKKYYSDTIGKIIFIDKDENNMFILCNDNNIKSTTRVGCGYGLHFESKGFDTAIKLIQKSKI